MTPLEQKISDLYPEPLSQELATEYAKRLIDFFEILWQIDRRLAAEERAKRDAPARSAGVLAAAQPPASE